jgi:hypothetical protein
MLKHTVVRKGHMMEMQHRSGEDSFERKWELSIAGLEWELPVDPIATNGLCAAIHQFNHCQTAQIVEDGHYENLRGEKSSR